MVALARRGAASGRGSILADLASGSPERKNPACAFTYGYAERDVADLASFFGRRQPVVDQTRVPPGQYVTRDFPVLSAGPTPHTPLDEWNFTIRGQVDEPVSWTWEEFLALPSDAPKVEHSLRNEVDEARHDMEGRLGRHAPRRRKH